MIQFIIVLACLALNAVFSAVEMAFVSVNRADLRKMADKGHVGAATLLSLRLNPERTLSVLQIGITLVGAISAAVGGAGAEESLAPIIESYLKVRESVAEAISIGIVVIPITIASVVIGELVPKSLALKHSKKISLFSAQGLFLFDKILAPVVDLLENMTKALVKLFTSRSGTTGHEATVEESAISIDSLSVPHKQFVLNLVNIEAKKAKDMMVDWESVIKVSVTNTTAEVLNTVVTSGHTRLPVLSEDNKIIGLLHTKEFITFLGSGDPHWPTIIRPILRVRTKDDGLKTLRLMQEKRSHLALVTDEDRVLGVITMEDIIEEIIGEVLDEDDDGIIKRILAARSRRGFRGGPKRS